MDKHAKSRIIQQISISVKPEGLFVSYLFLFSILKPVTVLLSSVSTMILLAATMIIVALSVYVGKPKFSVVRFEKFFWLMACLITVFGLDYILRENTVLPQYAYQFCIYGAVPLFLLQYVRNYRLVLSYWCYAAIAVGLMYLADPFFKYPWSGGYMPFGFNQMLPAFCGAAVLFFFYRKVRIWPVMLVFFLELLVYANKGATLAAAAVTMVLYILFGFKPAANEGIKSITRRVSIVFGTGLVLLLLFDPLLDLLGGILDFFGVSSYALNSIRYGGLERIVGLRTDIWTDVLKEFTKNPLFGTGIGTYQAYAKVYPHNVFLEVLNASGLIAAGFFAVMLVKSVFGFVAASKQKKNQELCVFTLMYLMLWIVPMMISLTMWSYMPFWVYWGMWLYRKKSPAKRTLKRK